MILEQRPMHIDEQARFDLACGVVAEAHTWESVRDALNRAVDFWPQAINLYAKPEGSGIALA